MSIFPLPYRILSVNDKFFAISSPEDKPGDKVLMKPGHPEHCVLFSNHPIGNAPVVVKISGVAPKKLYISLEGDKVLWSDKDDGKKNEWVVRKDPKGSYVVSPANGEDLYWVDEKHVQHLEVRPGKDIRPPQNEFFFIPA